MLGYMSVSWIGIVFLLALFIPNLFWTKCQPTGYQDIVSSENRMLLLLERFGQIGVSVVVVCFNPMKVLPISPRSWMLVFSLGFMLLYEIGWVRYFKSEHSLRDFYGSLLGIPVPLASLPILAFFLLGIYGKNALLLFCLIALGIGHIGIHLNHARDLKQTRSK